MESPKRSRMRRTPTGRLLRTSSLGPRLRKRRNCLSVRALTEDFLENPSLRACLPPALVTNPLIGTNPNKRFMETRKINE